MQQDYMLRMIQQLSGFVSGLLQLRRGGRSEEAVQQIQEAIGRFSGLSATLVHAISEDDLIELLRARGGVDPERGWALAELLREEALAYQELDQPEEAAPRFLKSMRLYLEVLDVMEEHASAINVDGLEEVIDQVAGYDLSPTSRIRLVEYFVETGRFDRAENVVHWSLDADEVSPDVLEDAWRFYDGLTRIPHLELERGGLPIDEVREGLRAIEERLDPSEPAAIPPQTLPPLPQV